MVMCVEKRRSWLIQNKELEIRPQDKPGTIKSLCFHLKGTQDKKSAYKHRMTEIVCEKKLKFILK